MDVGDTVRIKKGLKGRRERYEGQGVEPRYDDWGVITEFVSDKDKRFFAKVHFGNGNKEGIFEIYQLTGEKPKRINFGVLHKLCRQCDKPFETTSSLAVVHPGCREAYYKGLRRRQYENKIRIPSRVRAARGKYFVNEQPCAACTLLLLTKKRRFFNETTKQTEEHFLCPLCLALVRCGFMEPITWKKIDALSASGPNTAP